MAGGAVLTLGPVLEEQVHRDGLLVLQRVIGEADLLDFPKRANGTPVLLRQSFFEKLLGGQLELLSFPPADVIAAQADIRNLSLSQLLHIRCSHLDFNSGPSVPTQGEFLATVEGILESRIAARLAREGGPVLPPNGQASELVRLVLLIYGAVQHMCEEGAATQRWLVRCGATEGALVLQDCHLDTLKGGEPTYCHRNLSRASAAVPRAKRQVHWEVEVTENPKDFVSNSPGRKDSERERRPRLSGQRLQGRRSGESVEDMSSAASQSQDPESPSKDSPMRQGSVAEANELCVDLAAKLDAEAAEEASRLRTELSDAKRTAAGAVAEAEVLRVELKVAKETAAKAAAEAKEVQGKLAVSKDVADATQRAEALRTELAGAQEAKAEAIAEAEALRAELAALKAAAAERGVQEAAKESQNLEAHAVERECAEAKAAAEKARAEAKEMGEKVEALRAELDAATSSTAGLRAELDAAKAAASKAEAELDAAKRVTSKALNAELEAAREAASKAETVSPELEATKEAASKVEALSAELATAKEAASEAEGLRSELRALKEAKSGSEALRAELDAAKEAMRKAGEEAEQVRGELNAAQQKAEEQLSAAKTAEKAQAEAAAKAKALQELLAKSHGAEASWKAEAEQWRAKANAAAEEQRAALAFGDAVDLCGAPPVGGQGQEFADAEESKAEKEADKAANAGFFGRMLGRFGNR